MKRLALALLALLIASCIHHVHTPAIETFEQHLERTEGVTCLAITAHEDGDAPNCRKLYEAFVRGRNRVAAVYPEAARVPMSAFTFVRPKLYWVDGKPYPLIIDYWLPGASAPHEYLRGITYVPPSYSFLIAYAYEQVVEHETVHAMGWYLDKARQRTPADISADSGGYTPPAQEFWRITCHGTPDDPFGTPHDRGGCAMPYDGPPHQGSFQP